MTTRNAVLVVHQPDDLGGLDTSQDPTVLPAGYLTVADNIEYLEARQRKKRLGTLIYNTSSSAGGGTGVLVSTAANVRALGDFWRYDGSSLTPTQHIINVTSASVFRSTGDGNFTALTASSSFGSNTSVITNITVAGGYAVISDGVSRPVYNDQSTALSVFTTGTPTFEFSRYHLRRMFYSGISTDPSAVYFTAAGNVLDSTGGDTGSLPINEGDGDRVIGLSEPFLGNNGSNSIYAFKGPNRGGVYEIGGNTSTAFTLSAKTFGAPALNHKSIITTDKDIFWMSQYGIHSLYTTVNYGNVEQGFISLPIQATFREVLKTGALSNVAGFWHPTRNLIGWLVTPNGGTQNWVLVYNYALSDPAPGGKKFWSIWKWSGFNVVSVGIVKTPSVYNNAGLPRPFYGGDDGRVYMGDQPTLNDMDGTVAYTATARTPTITRFNSNKGLAPETQEKVIDGVMTMFNAKGAYSANISITVDTRTQSTTISQSGGGDTLT
jgi:hypothetical protein